MAGDELFDVAIVKAEEDLEGAANRKVLETLVVNYIPPYSLESLGRVDGQLDV
jgi:hypothetical protein